MNSQFPNNRWVVLRFMLLANFLNLLDITIVNVAIPRISIDYALTPEKAQWISITYLIAFASGLLPFGKLGDIRGYGRVYQGGLIAFIAASVSCGIAQNIEWLLISRVAQGLASAAMVPQVLAIAVNIFPQQEKPKMFALVGMISSLASIMGPLVGGVLIAVNLFDLDWRTIFLMNLPIGLVALWGVKSILPHAEFHANKEKIDWIGNCLFALSSCFLIVPLIEGYSLGWPMWIVCMLLMAIPTIIFFAYWLKLANNRNYPCIINGRVYRNRIFLKQLLNLMLFSSSVPGLFFVLTYYLQTQLSFSPLQSGLATVAFPLGVFFILC